MKFFLACKAFLKTLREKETSKQLINEPKEDSKLRHQSHLRLLNLLQQQGRLIDFLKEDLSSYSDEQVGTAVRKIHADCSKLLEELVTVRPIMQEEEGQIVTIPQGYDHFTIKVIGKVKGEPPYKGILRHKGWKAHKLKLPETHSSHFETIMPAEVEL